MEATRFSFFSMMSSALFFGGTMFLVSSFGLSKGRVTLRRGSSSVGFAFKPSAAASFFLFISNEKNE